MPDQPSHYLCPICRSVACEVVGYGVRSKQGDPAVGTLPLYACMTCSNVFLDPRALTRGYEDRPRTNSPPSSGRAYTEWSLINTARKDRKA
jgi:hypothetical protein